MLISPDFCSPGLFVCLFVCFFSVAILAQALLVGVGHLKIRRSCEDVPMPGHTRRQRHRESA